MQPFLLRPDGSADVDVLSFFYSSSFGLLSEQTQWSYAKDVRLYLSFLESQQVPWRDATYDDALNFEFWRRRDPANPRRVSAAKFAREWAACRKFYEWQLRRGVVASVPLSSSGELQQPGDRAPRPSREARPNRVKWLTPRAFNQWRAVGLGGSRPDGSFDRGWRGRNGGRNVAFANLLWTSGLRLREAASLLMSELPDVDHDARYLRGRVGSAVAKGRGRDFWMAASTRSELDGYRLSSRAAAVRRAQREHRYELLRGRLVVVGADRDRLLVEDESGDRRETRVGEFTARERVRLLVQGPGGLEPAMLFLGESGLPMDYPTWESVSSAATRRCREIGVEVGCYPHMLRHSFALRMLLTLTHAFDRRMGLSPEERREYRLLFGDPWVLVQTLLGHASPETTRSIYLEPVNGLQVELFLNGDLASDDIVFSDVVQRHLAATGLVSMGSEA